jgi:hypothetical protein
VIGGDIFEGLPANDEVLERAWSQAYNEVLAEIQNTDQTISQENLPQGTVMAAMLERAKDIIRQQKIPDPNINNNNNTNTNTEALADDLLNDEPSLTSIKEGTK